MRARADYESRRGEIQSELEELDRRWNRVAALRAAGFVAFVGLSILSYLRGGGWPWAAVLSLCVFVACVSWHQRIGARRAALKRVDDWYARSLGRLDGIPDPLAAGGDDPPDAHPYAAELDLFGSNSLFAWMCHAQSLGGAHRLGEWLSRAAEPAEILRRQAAVAELRDAPVRREEMLLCAGARPAREALEFQRWARQPASVSALGALRAVSFVLGLCLLGSLVAWLGFGARPAWLLLFSFVGYAWSSFAGGRLRSSLRGLENARAELRLLRRLLEHVERSSFDSEKLRALHDEICRGDGSASKRFGQLERRIEFHEAARNALFAPVAALFLWQTQWAGAIESWRRQHAAELVGALDALSDYEALQSLARLAYERDCVTPKLGTDSHARIRILGVGHPLLSRCVRNDLSLGGSDAAIWMISGSNMSGKSTFLRAVGVNLVLALAGGQVLAEEMEFTRVSLGASIRAGDSLSSGESRFAHELARLRTIVTASAGELPVCFLLDELLHGTHSHDRRIGADAILRKLAGRGAVGLVTTHDLSLCEIKPELQDLLRNVHFQDDVVDGAASFDYRLREGVVEKSNALRLMRAAGLIDGEEGLD